MAQSATFVFLTVQFANNPATSQATSQATSLATGPIHMRPIYSNLYKQAFSNQKVCFLCGQKDHFIKDCPTAVKTNKVLLVQKDNTELEKKES